MGEVPLANILPPAQVVPAPQVMPAQMPLVAALMGHQMPSSQAPQIPLASLAQIMMQQDKNGGSAGDSLWSGLSNWFNGAKWNGMPTASTLGGLDTQAQNYIAGGAAGL